MPFEVEDRFIAIPVSAERTLRGHLWLPKGAGAVPAILDTNPYRSWDMSRASQDAVYRYWTSHGYACLCVDTMGSGNSDGVLRDEYTAAEIEDALVLIEWCAAQPWCDGQVGMHGFSWAAFVALRAAAKRPAALKAMVLGGVSEDGWRTDIHHLGGVPYVAQVDWAGTMLMFNALPPDPAVVGDDWLSLWRQRLEANAPSLDIWMAHPTRDEYWESKATALAADETQLPLLLYCGTGDKYATSVLRIAEAWQGPVKTILGPWDHTLPDFSPREPRIGFLDEALRWWDAWLKGAANGAKDEAAYRVWFGAPDAKSGMADGQWIATDGVAQNALRFDVPDGGSIVPGPRTPEKLRGDLYEDTPAPFQSGDLSLKTTFERDTDVFGLPSLSFRTETRRGQLVARLFDIAPDGTTIRIVTGAIDLAVANDALTFPAVAWRVKAGHALGLVLSAEAWPTLWPTSTKPLRVRDVRLSLPLAEANGTPLFGEPHTPSGGGFSELKWLNTDDAPLPPATLSGAELTRQVMAHHLDATGADYLIAKRFTVADSACKAVWSTAIERPGWSVRIATTLTVTAAPDGFCISWSEIASSGDYRYSREGTTVLPRF